MIKLLKILKITVSGFFLFALIALGTKLVSAQSLIPLTVAPARQQINVDPGATEYLNIKFINQGTSPLYGNLKVVDFIVLDNEGNPTLLDDVKGLSTRFSGASWIKLPQDKASIPAGGILTLQLKMYVPKDARPGGRYVAVSFEPTGSVPGYEGSVQEGALGISPRIAGLIYIRVKGAISENAYIESFKVPSFVEFGPVPVSFSILNRGDYHITPKGQVTFTDWFGNVVDTKTLEPKNVFPDVSRAYDEKLGGRLLFGRYKVSLLAAYGETGQALSSQAYVWAFPVTLIILILLGIIIVTLSGVLITKRFKKKEEKLIEELQEEKTELEELKEKLKDEITNAGTPTPKK